MPDSSTRRVMLATWGWRLAGSAPAQGNPVNLRRSALVQAFVMVLVAGALQFILHHGLLARIVLGLAGVVLFLGLAYPPAYRPIHAFGRWLGRAVGQVLTYLLLVPFFFLFFTPVALVLRLQARDPLHRRFRDLRWTYWIARSPKTRDENIDRQFLREDKESRGALREVSSTGSPEGVEGR